MLLPQEYLWNIRRSATKQHKRVERSPVINNPKLAEDEGDGERALSLHTHKKAILFCSQRELRHCGWRKSISSTQRVGEEKWEPWEALIIVMDLSRLCKTATSYVSAVYQIRGSICITFSPHLWLLGREISGGAGPLDFPEFDILMNRFSEEPQLNPHLPPKAKLPHN